MQRLFKVVAMVLAAAFACVPGAGATTLKAISGDEQIQQAEAIFRGRVERIDAARDWSKPHGPVISTVRFTRLAVYKGQVASAVSLDFLGGAADGVELRVEGMPTFKAGQEYVLFVSGKQNRACPVVGWTEGQLLVDRKPDADGAVTVTSTASDWLRHTSMARGRAVMPSSLGLSQFESVLRERIAQIGSK